jgi:hypothetical protein
MLKDETRSFQIPKMSLLLLQRRRFHHPHRIAMELRLTSSQYDVRRNPIVLQFLITL